MAQAATVMEQLQVALESRAFELAYERTCRRVEGLCDAEQVRQLRVLILTLEDDKDLLHTQLIRNEDRTDGLERFNERLQEDHEVCANNLESARGQLRIKIREVETMKVLAIAVPHKCNRQADASS